MTNYPRAKIERPGRCMPAPCSRCGGTGEIPGYRYIKNGICFRCQGNAVDPRKKNWGYPITWNEDQCEEFDTKRLAKLEQNRIKREAKRQAEADKIYADNVAAYPIIEEAKDFDHAIVQDIIWKAHKYVITEKQAQLIVNCVERHAKIEENKKCDREASNHIGAEGDRTDFENLTVTFVTYFDTQFGTMFVTGMKDVNGNVIIYKGKHIADRDEVINVKATIKEHGERDDVKQTIINRPVVTIGE
tara:strand:- start:271 stop:1005 length:735 start_codon:yes stop_codon:yes gene_type:complete